MPHIGEEGCLQTFTFLCFVSGCDEGRLQFLPVVNAHRRTHDLDGVAVHVAISNRGIALFPVGKSLDISRLDAILLMIVAGTAFTEIIHRSSHALGI